MITPETYEAVMNKYGYCCAHCGSNQNIELHHMMSKSKTNRKRYPLFIDSEYNLICLCGLLSNNCHGTYKHLYKIRDIEAREYEETLADCLLQNTKGKKCQI